MRVLVLALLLPATAVSAMIDPCSQEQMIIAATNIVQIGDIAVGPANADMRCAVSGTVLRSWGDDFAVGDPLKLTMQCGWVGLVGGAVWMDRADLVQVKVLELHLDPDMSIAAYGAGMVALTEPTERPAFVFNCAG